MLQDRGCFKSIRFSGSVVFFSQRCIPSAYGITCYTAGPSCRRDCPTSARHHTFTGMGQIKPSRQGSGCWQGKQQAPHPHHTPRCRQFAAEPSSRASRPSCCHPQAAMPLSIASLSRNMTSARFLSHVVLQKMM